MLRKHPGLRGVLCLIGIAFAHAAGAFDCPELRRAAREIDTGGYPSGLLWRVETADGRENFVFGTIHISDPRVTGLHRSIREALASSAHFTMEVMLDPDAVQRMSRAMYYQHGETLSQLLPPALYQRAEDLLARYGVGPAAVDKLKPWAAYTTLSLPPGQREPPLDLKLMIEARDAGKTVAGLETLDEQIAVFDGLDDAEQIELLQMTICHYEQFQSEVEEMIDYYETRDLAAMMRMAVRYESPLQDRFMDLLLRQRNHRMAERLRTRLDRGGSFVAIGALHLPGREGVLALLEGFGYRISRVY